MDESVRQLATQVTTWLAPALPYLVEYGKHLADEAGKTVIADAVKALGRSGWERAVALWEHLRPGIEAREAAREIVLDIAGGEADEDARASLRRQMGKVLAADPALVDALRALVAEAGDHVEASGERAWAVKAERAALADHGATAVGGDYHRHEHYHQASAPPPPGADLRDSYLRRVVEECGRLYLEGVDPEVAGDAAARLRLDSVYTALLTTASRGEERQAMPDLARREEPRRRSALERLDGSPHLVLQGEPGSGKSTFARFVALCLAGEVLGHEHANLDLLGAPLPDEDGEDGDERQPWGHGALLPVLVVLRDFAARGLPERPGERGCAAHLIDFVNTELGKAGLADFAPVLWTELREGGLLLLDGLDEVPEAERRREQIREVVHDFRKTHGCRILVTCRTYAYQGQGWRLDDFDDAVLAPLSDGQVRRFVRRWYAHLAEARRADRDEMRGRAALLEGAVFGQPRLREMAGRPLLLALMASLHAWRGGELPRDRERLYRETVDLLLERWEKRRVEHDRTDPARLLEYLRDRAGLLLERGVGVYSFPHRSFQEYLAACHLSHVGIAAVVSRVRDDPQRWREVALLAAARVAGTSQDTLWSLVGELCSAPLAEEDDSVEGAWGAQIAGQALVESAILEKLTGRRAKVLDDVRYRLVTLLGRARFPAVERVTAGASLAVIGDPRFDPEHWMLPADAALGFRRVPGGAFDMGEGKERHRVELPDFWLARFPVTVAQFGQHVNVEWGVAHDDEGWRTGPANHPFVWVSWDEALAYCRWLGERLHDAAPALAAAAGRDAATQGLWEAVAQGRLQAAVPSEAEWESAARGERGGVYPWGDEPDPERANYDETGIGDTNTVGCFPADLTCSYGCEEMAGNVLEWTRTLWGGNDLGREFTHLYERDEGSEALAVADEARGMLRGGGFLGSDWSIRCASRYRYSPARCKRFGYDIGFRVVLSGSLDVEANASEAD